MFWCGFVPVKGHPGSKTVKNLPPSCVGAASRRRLRTYPEALDWQFKSYVSAAPDESDKKKRGIRILRPGVGAVGEKECRRAL